LTDSTCRWASKLHLTVSAALWICSSKNPKYMEFYILKCGKFQHTSYLKWRASDLFKYLLITFFWINKSKAKAFREDTFLYTCIHMYNTCIHVLHALSCTCSWVYNPADLTPQLTEVLCSVIHSNIPIVARAGTGLIYSVSHLINWLKVWKLKVSKSDH